MIVDDGQNLKDAKELSTASRTIQPPMAPLINGSTFFSRLCAKLSDVLGILRIERLKMRSRLIETACSSG
jgi:hypothetical protein